MFPKDPILRKRWVHVIKQNGKGDNWKPIRHSIVCHDHFRKDDFMSGPTDSKFYLIFHLDNEYSKQF